MGVTNDLVRVSVGIETVEDLHSQQGSEFGSFDWIRTNIPEYFAPPMDD